MIIDKVPAPPAEGRNAMYYARGQDKAYRMGAYDYLESIAMVSRMATLAAYVNRLGLKSVLDLGCGTADLLAYLAPEITYIGVDISEKAIETARECFKDRPQTHLFACDFRDWECPFEDIDALVWAGIGCAWTHQGARGQMKDWLGILAYAERLLRPDGYLLFELVTPHWHVLEKLIDGRYRYTAGCDLDCFQSQESPKRSIRVLQRKDARPLPITLGHRGSSLIPGHLARHLIGMANHMGQMTDTDTSNLGFGYLYYGLTRLYQPETVVCIGSYRGFSTICMTLGLVDNQKGTCHFIDPGKVDGHWHDPQNVEHLAQRFNLGHRWKHQRKTSQEVIAQNSIPDTIDLLLIDGDHSYDGVKFDFDHFGSRVRPGGLILLHDSINEGRGFTPWEVKAFLEAEVYTRPEYEPFTFPLSAGLTLVRKR